jgi:hypothetical protein
VGPVDVAAAASVAAGLPVTLRTAVPPPSPSVVPLRSTGFWLAVVTAAIVVNQVLFTVYVLRVHGGDPGFISRYLPDGWFRLADGPSMRAFAKVFPAPSLLSPTVLRVQAALELPFVLLAYLTVAGWFDPSLRRRLLALPVLSLAATAYTVAFGLIEWSLHNPYTIQDLWVRTVAAVLTVLFLRRLDGGRGPRVTGAADLVLFVVSAGALGYFVLVVYDTCLLYNLGDLGSYVPLLAVASAGGVGAHLLRRRLRPSDPGRSVSTLTTGLGWFLALFFVPALPVRYALSFGSRPIAVAAGTVVVVVAVALTVARLRSGVLYVVPASLVGIAVAAATLFALPSGGYPEARLLSAAAAFLLVVTATASLTDVVVARRAFVRGP